jgi:putative hydrolase of the HAD superfamily
VQGTQHGEVAPGRLIHRRQGHASNGSRPDEVVRTRHVQVGDHLRVRGLHRRSFADRAATDDWSYSGSVPRYVIFDLFHTLVGFVDDDRDRVVAEMAGMVGVPAAALVRAYNDTWRQRVVQWDVEQTVRMLSERVGGRPSPDSIARAARHRRDLGARILAAVAPATLDVLDRLRDNGARLALVSNATADTAEEWPHCTLAERFDVAVFSRPAECVYVGDGAADELTAAAALGMTVFRTTEFSDTDPSWPGRTIAELAELLPLLRPETGN